jgi:enoyl-CoA hydratase
VSEVHLRTHGRVGHISLARPKALHALTQGMCEAMSEALLSWRDDPAIEAVLIDHAEGRGFCAGGDVALVRRSALENGGVSGRAFFFAEYRLNHLLFTYSKPLVTFMDGVTMGGGVGISQPAQFRVATEHTRFAMPETGIGLFPDVGGGWYLPRLEGRVGAFLALTGARLDGAECLALGLATHYLSSDRLAEAKDRIAAHPDRIGGILGELSVTAPPAAITGQIDKINRLFASDRYEDILAALEKDGGEWAAKELDALHTKSPQTCKVALRQLREGAAMPDFAAEMAQEYAIGSRVVAMPDFLEGVRALIVDKDNSPKWDPPTAEAVTDDWIDAIFAPLPDSEKWTPLN